MKELSERFARKSEKYKWITHAETNAIFNAARTGISLVGATIYASTFPCSACAQAIVQSGIKRVFTHGEYWPNDPNGYEKALEIFAEAHVLIDAPAMRKLDHKCRRKYWASVAKRKAAKKKPANDNDGRSASRPRKKRDVSERRSAAKRREQKRKR